jgi:hypothetical protein
MNEEPTNTKRPRLTPSSDGADDDEASPVTVASAAVPMAPTVGPTAGRAGGGTAAPSGPVLCRELSKLSPFVVADGGMDARTEAIRALRTIKKWACASRRSEDEEEDFHEELRDAVSTEDEAFLKHFIRYGGIPRLFDFLKAHLSDAECVSHVADIVRYLTRVGRNCCFDEIEDLDVNDFAGNAIEATDGIHTLLLANDEFENATTDEEMKALTIVWGALCNTLRLNYVFVNHAEVLLVVETACDWLGKLSNYDTATSYSSELLGRILHILGGAVCYEWLTVNNVESRKLVAQSLTALHIHKDHLKDSSFLCHGMLRFMESCSHQNTISKGSVYEDILPFCASALKEFPTIFWIQRSGLELLTKILEEVEKDAVVRSGAGVGVALVLQSDDVEEDIKKLAHEVMKELYT